MKRTLLFTILACAGLAGLGAGWLARPDLPEPAPAVNLTIVGGNPVSMTALRGRPVLLTFWSTDCASCVAEMPHLSALYDRLHERGFALFGVAMPYDQPAQVLRLIDHRRPSYPIALDPLGRVARAFGDVRVTPTSFLISPAGNIVAREVGPLDLGRITAQIEAMLESG